MKDKLVTILTFRDHIKAHLIKNKLENNGIPCVLFDENVTSMLPLHDANDGKIKLKIKEQHVESALNTIGFDESQLDNLEVVVCSNCNEPKFINNESTSVLGLIKDFIGAFVPAMRKKSTSCDSCGSAINY